MMMTTKKDYCDYETCVALKELGFIGQGRCYYDLDIEPNKLRHFGVQVLTTRSAEALNFVLAVHLYNAQKWLREEKNIHVIPKIYLYHDSNHDERASWECSIYAEWSAIYNIGKGLSYEEALLLGIKEAVKILKDK